jgi:hypothetical protein
MNRGCPEWPFYGQRRADEHPVPREHHVRLRLVVEVGEPAHDGSSVSATRLDLNELSRDRDSGCSSRLPAVVDQPRRSTLTLNGVSR